MTRVFVLMVACLLLPAQVDGQGRRGGVSGSMRAGSMGASMRGMPSSAMRTPSSSMRMPTSSMRVPSSSLRAPTSSLRSSSLAARHPSHAARLPHTRGHLHGSHLRHPHVSHYHRPISPIHPWPSYRSFSYGVHVGSYPSYLYGFPYTRSYYSFGYSYPSFFYSRPLVSTEIVSVPVFDVYRYGVSPTISPEAIVPQPPAPSGASGPERLTRSLAGRSGGEGWLEYLAPHRVIELMKQNNSEAIAELIRRYDGVLNNAELRWIANMDGFAATRNLLHQFARAPLNRNQPIPAPPPVDDQVDQPEGLPNGATATSLKDAV